MVYFLGVPLCAEELFYEWRIGGICTKKNCQRPLPAGL
jgi:hypothetical protein